MRHVFTTREKILVIILVVIVVFFGYYSLVLTPINDEVSQYNTEAAALEDEITINTVQAAQVTKMKSEIEALKASGAKTIPEYDNSKNLIVELNSILKDAVDYTLSFDATSNIDYVVLRPAYLSITTKTYKQARKIIDKLYDSDNSMMISDVNIAMATSSSTYSSTYVTTTLRITYFEVNQNYVAPVTEEETTTE